MAKISRAERKKRLPINKVPNPVPADVEKSTYISIILDKSQSMQAIKPQTIDGFNEQVSTIRKNASKGGKTFVSLTTFNDFARIEYFNAPIKHAGVLTTASYKPSGMTALWDAVGDTIVNLKQHDSVKNDQQAFLVIIITDGQENASTRWNKQTVAQQIKHLQNTGKWTFVFIGANINLDEAADVGVFKNNTMAWDSTPIGTQSMYHLNNVSLEGYMKTRSLGSTQSLNFFDNPTNAAPGTGGTTKTDK